MRCRENKWKRLCLKESGDNMKVGLVDDRQIDLDKMHAIVQTIPNIEIIFATTSADKAYEHIKKEDIDVLIADIEMPNLSGYELADIIHTHALNITVIFVTGTSGYAVHAFELNVHDYIMKPYPKERLVKSVERLLEKTKSAEITGRLYIKQKNDIHILQKKDIIFIERSGRSTTIYTKAEAITTYLTLNELEGELRERDFIRSHRSFIINIHYVKNFSLYAKNSYVVSFDGIEQKAMITKEKVNFLQEYYF